MPRWPTAAGLPPRAARLLLLASLLLVLGCLPVQAGQSSDPAEHPGFLTRYDFYLSAAALLVDDEQFNWDADFGGDVDLLDYGLGRATFLANFEAVLGEGPRRFDPVQGNYTLDLAASWRLPLGELAGVFHHVSRHLSDRAKGFPIDWNMAGVEHRVRRQAGRLNLRSQARMLWTTTRSFVDYEREFSGRIVGRYALTDRLAGIAAVGLTVVGVEREVFGRSAQTGAYIEGGFRVRGEGGAVELFGAVERRVDADPILYGARTWTLVGFRLLGS